MGAATAAGAAYTAYSDAQAAKANEAAEKTRAAIAIQNARSAVVSGELEAAKEARERSQAIASGRATFAANGVQLDADPTSAPTIWADDQRIQLGEDLRIIMENAQNNGWNYTQEAKMSLARAKMQRRAATAAYIKGGIGVGTAAASTTADLYAAAPTKPPPKDNQVLGSVPSHENYV